MYGILDLRIGLIYFLANSFNGNNCTYMKYLPRKSIHSFAIRRII